jgi:ketosteroid isomerase-like protein
VTEVGVEARVGLVRAVFEAVDRGDMDAGLSMCTEDIELLPLSAVGIEGRSYRGHDGIREWQREREETWDLRIVIDEVELIGDRALALGRLRTRGRASGVEVELAAGWVLDFRDDMVARVEAFSHPADARSAAERPAP